MNEIYNEEELKLRVTHELDVLEFMDTIEMSFAELLDIIFPELDEEQKEDLARAIER